MRAINIVAGAMRRVRAFVPEARGQVAITFAVVLVPVIGAIGAGIDFGRASLTSTSMQAALDATALGLLTTPASLSPNALPAAAQKLFASSFKESGVQDVRVNPVYDAASSTPLGKRASTPDGSVPFRGRRT